MFMSKQLRESPHLHARVRDLSQSLYLAYDRAEDILAEIEMLMMSEPEEPEARLIVGLSGNGKTAIARRLLRSFPPKNDPDAPGAEFPVIRVLMPGRTSRRAVALAMLKSLGQTRKPHTQTDDLLASAFAVIRSLGVKVILLDEFQHLNSGSANERQEMRNEIKNLGDNCKVLVVGLGTETALNVVNSEPQFIKRFETRTLPKWRDNDETRSLIHNFELSLQLQKESKLAENDKFVQRLLEESEGTIGAMHKILRRAAIHAMLSGSERIEAKTLKEIEWIRPSQRILKSKALMGVPVVTHGRKQFSLDDQAQALAA
jgi:hypothetical protein